MAPLADRDPLEPLVGRGAARVPETRLRVPDRRAARGDRGTGLHRHDGDPRRVHGARRGVLGRPGRTVRYGRLDHSAPAPRRDDRTSADPDSVPGSSLHDPRARPGGHERHLLAEYEGRCPVRRRGRAYELRAGRAVRRAPGLPRVVLLGRAPCRTRRPHARGLLRPLRRGARRGPLAPSRGRSVRRPRLRDRVPTS